MTNQLRCMAVLSILTAALLGLVFILVTDRHTPRYLCA